MNYKYAIYSSGHATRVINYFNQTNYIEKFPFEFIYYDGFSSETLKKLTNLFGKSKVKIPSKSLEICSFKERNNFVNNDLYELLFENKIDYLFVFGSGLIQEKIINKWKNKIINFHPSLLPSFPGLNSVTRALNSQAKIIGHTAHFIVKEIDAGPIIMQIAVARSRFENDMEGFLNLQLLMLEQIWNHLETDGFLFENGVIKNINKGHFESIELIAF
jgi:phosphoribosylglycinamide formyltransferase-1